MTVRKICILGLDDYAMLTGSAGCVGGECVQHVLLARAWRDLGLDVSIVVRDAGQPRVVQVDGMRAVAAFRARAGIPMLRFFHPRISSVVRAMREIDADVYYQSPSSPFTGVVAWFARRYGRRSLIRIASDLGCIPGRQLMRYQRDRSLYDYGLRNASLIAAQTQHQRRLLQQHYGFASEVVNMAVEVPPAGEAREKDIDVLWVGNLRSVKRPELALDLARRLPQYSFTMAGGPLPDHEGYYEKFVRSAADLPNVRLLGAVRYQDIGEYFARAKVHLNTSSAEGFPNTFLQAWVRGLPVVSFFDPDRLIHKRGLGRAVTSIDEMALALDELLCDAERRAQIAERARAFALAEFSAPEVARRYLELLDASAPTLPIVTDVGRVAARGR